MGRDAEAVRLIAQALDQMQRVGMPVEHNAFFFVGQHNLFNALGQAKHGNVQPGFAHGFQRRVELSAAAVDENQIGKIGKPGIGRAFFHFFQSMGQASGEHFPHGSKIVGAFYGFDAEMPVFLVCAHPIDHDHHGAHGLRPLCVGNIVSLDAPGPLRQSQHVFQFFQRAYCALVRIGQALAAFFRLFQQIFLRQQDQFSLFPALWYEDVYPGLPETAESLFQSGAVGKIRVHQQLPGRHARLIVILRDKLRQRFLGGFLRAIVQRKAFRTDQPPTPHIHHLHQSAVFVDQRRRHILIPAIRHNGLLFLHQLVDGSDLIPVYRRPFIVPVSGRLVHFFLQPTEHQFKLSAQEIHHAFHQFVVFLLGNPICARGAAQADFIVHAGAEGLLRWQLMRAGANGENAPHRVQRVAHHIRAKIGAEVFRAIVRHAPHNGHARKRLLHIHAQIRIVLIVLKQDVIKRFVPLDQIAFQREGFHLAIHEHQFKVVHPCDHRAYLLRMIGGRLKILPHAIFEVFRLADINHLSAAFHNIAAWRIRQVFNLPF